MKQVGHSIPKKDSRALTRGKPVYTEDITPTDCLVIRLLRSPHAHAMIEEIDTGAAKKLPGVAAIFTWQDVPQSRFTEAGQTWPEMSPYDRLILDRHLRCVGDPVAIVAAETEEQADAAVRRIKVKYQILPAILDPEQALDNPVLIHPEENWRALVPSCGADNKRNLVASGTDGMGDIEEELSACDAVIDETYSVPACQQCMMETIRTYAYYDVYGKLTLVSSTQIPFHVRRIISNALELSPSQIRVIKPRIGGGFGAKQTAVCEIYPAFVTRMTGRPSRIVYTREEALTISTPRHAMKIHVRVGASKDGVISAIWMHTLSNTGAYGEHGPTTVDLSGHKSIPLYTHNLKAFCFKWDVVYTNTMSAGAYRGYGATQGIFALESAVNELAAKLQMDPAELREKNIACEGEFLAAYHGEWLKSCALDRCIATAKRLAGWDPQRLKWVTPEGHIRALGFALSMQGSGIASVDTGAVTIRLSDDGTYNLSVGATDMGTGCDTILSMIAAEALDCSTEQITVHGVDTDISPYDSGSYASSTTYVTGMAAYKACMLIREKIRKVGALLLECSPEEADFDGKQVLNQKTGKTISLREIAGKQMTAMTDDIAVTASNGSLTSPPPFMAGCAEIDFDPGTLEVHVIRYTGVVDCGTVVNPNLARIQAEGGILQGIGMALTEEPVMDDRGRTMSNSLMQYRIPTRMDAPHIQVTFEESYEPTGPYGAKSIGECVINTSAPAVADAVWRAAGVRVRDLPITPDKLMKVNMHD